VESTGENYTCRKVGILSSAAAVMATICRRTYLEIWF
jgi:hypothetical protein